MILKECNPRRQAGETKKEVPLKDSESFYLNISIETAQEKICRELLSLPRHGVLSAVELERRLYLPVFTFGRALHELAKRGLVTIRGSVVRANRRTETVLVEEE